MPLVPTTFEHEVRTEAGRVLITSDGRVITISGAHRILPADVDPVVKSLRAAARFVQNETAFKARQERAASEGRS